jgi:hypothetical protein
VEKNFRKAVLGQVQKVAYEKMEVMGSKDKKRPRAMKEGFISVETMGVQCSKVDTRVINRLKYLRSTQRADTKQDHRWLGYTANTKEYIELAEEWVRSNFDENYLDQVICCSRSKKPFILIPPGDNRKHSFTAPTTGPIIHYQQKDGERTCMVYALASAIHVTGRTEIAAMIFNNSKRYVNAAENAFKLFVDDLRLSRKLFRTKFNYPSTKTDLVGDIGTGIYLTRIRGSDGKDDHCVAVTSKWIFDSNFKHALPRNMESFNLCCSSEEVESLYVANVEIAHFPEIT